MVAHYRFSLLLHGLIIALLLVFAPQAVAQTLNGRVVAHVQSEDVKVLDVGDVPGHTLALVRFSGLAFLDNGEVAEVRGTETLDRTEGKGTYRGYEVLTFEDGSTVVSRFEGRNMPGENEGQVQFEGTFRYVHGTGRFAGIEGSGSHEGVNHVQSGVGGYYDFEGTYSLSPNRERNQSNR
jgi:hypothetical protein